MNRKIFFSKDNIYREKCYKRRFSAKALHVNFCTLKSHKPDNSEHDMLVDGTNKIYSTRFHGNRLEHDISAYVKYVRDVTEETKIKFEKERLSMYFQSVVKICRAE